MKPFFSSDSSSSSQGAPSKHQTVLSANIHCFDPGSNILWRNILEFSTADYRVGEGLELWKGQRNVFTLPLPPSPRTCGECPAIETFLRHGLKLATKKIRPSTASLCCWFPICSQQRNQILVQTANWLEFMPALLVLSQEEKDPKMPSIPQSPQRQWRPQRWTTAWRPPDRWTQGWTLCFSARFENIRLLNTFGTVSDETSTAQHSWAGTYFAAFRQDRLWLKNLRHCLEVADNSDFDL